MKGGYDENIASKGGVKSYTSELLSWCDANILWKQFSQFSAILGSFRCAEKYLVGCWPFWFATEVFC